MVEANSRSHVLISPAMSAGTTAADLAFATVRVEVSVSNGVVDSESTSVSVDSFDVLSIAGFQSIIVSTELRTSWVQACRL